MQRVEEKEKEKVEKYFDLKKEIGRLRKLRNVEKARHNMQCWSNVKDCLVGNCKNTEKGIGNVKTRVYC